MYPWGSFHCAALFCPATAAVCLDKTFWYSKLTAWIRLRHTGRSQWHYRAPTRKRACVRVREHSDVAQSLPSLIVMTFRRLRSRRWLQSSDSFACPAWNQYLSCSANRPLYLLFLPRVTCAKRRGPGGPQRFNSVCVCVRYQTPFSSRHESGPSCFCRQVSTR